MNFKSPKFKLEREFSILYSGYIPPNTFIYFSNSGEEPGLNVILKIYKRDEREGYGEEIDLGNVEKNATLKVPIKHTPFMDKVYKTIPAGGSELYGKLFFSDNTGTLYSQTLDFVIKEDRGVKFGYTSLSIKLNDVTEL